MPTIGEEARPAYQAGTIREVVGVFDDQDHMQIAVDDLQHHGFNRANITTLADSRTIERETGHGYIHVKDVEDDAETPRAVVVSKRSLGMAEGVLIGVGVYIPTVVVGANLASKGASDGMLALGVMIAAGIGGLLGWYLAHRLDGAYNRRIRDQIQHGGIVLWASVNSTEMERRASEVMRGAAAHDVHAHDRPIMVKPMPGWIGPSYNMSFMRLLGM